LLLGGRAPHDSLAEVISQVPGHPRQVWIFTGWPSSSSEAGFRAVLYLSAVYVSVIALAGRWQLGGPWGTAVVSVARFVDRLFGVSATPSDR
jgi:hypothetical protein